ncbi:MAG: M20 family metallo-hydrolase [Solibacillus sp.]
MVHVQTPSIINTEEWTIEALIEWLADFGRTDEGGVTRLLYSDTWQQAQKALQQKMERAGLTPYADQVGNLFGRVEGTEQPQQVVLTGSHVDTVIQGGKYDGAYGVLASLLAVQRLLKKYGPPKKTIEVVSLCEEEGSRFPLTYWGSKNIVGEYDETAIAMLTDCEDVLFSDAMTNAGYPLAVYQSKKRQDLAYFVEVHIEQGVTLENQHQQIGVVSHIVGQQRFTVMFYGQSNHAGTTEMFGRKDAIVCAANAITLLTALANEKYSPKLRATIGQLQAKPNVPNVIAGEVSFTIDVRHHHQVVIDDFVTDMQDILRTIDVMYDVTHTIERFSADEPVQLDEHLQKMTFALAKKRGFSAMEMISGAGHDSQVFAGHIPTALLFVPSKNGISHSPYEFTATEELERGVLLVEDLLYQLAYEGTDFA